MKIEIEIPEQQEPTSGWVLDFKWLQKFTDCVNIDGDETISMEGVETVLLGLKEMEKGFNHLEEWKKSMIEKYEEEWRGEAV